MQFLTLLTILIAIVLLNLKDVDVKKNRQNDLSLLTKEENGFLFLSLKNRYTLKADDNYQFFINSDENLKSGFYGSDFLVENGRLFSYDGIQNVWKWKFETKLSQSNKDTNAHQFCAKIPIKNIVSKTSNKIFIKGIINSSDWKAKKSVIAEVKLKQKSLALQ